MSLKSYNKITVPAVSGSPVTLEVNFSEDPESKNMVKVNGRDVIEMKDLFGFLMIAGSPEIQSELMPVQKTEVVRYEKFHNVVVNKDLKKGDRVKVRCEISVPVTVTEGLAGLVDKKIQIVPKPSGLLLPS